jgi:hypothetical protein
VLSSMHAQPPFITSVSHLLLRNKHAGRPLLASLHSPTHTQLPKSLHRPPQGLNHAPFKLKQRPSNLQRPLRQPKPSNSSNQ